MSAPARLLQRKCDCGGTPHAGAADCGPCADKKQKMQRRAISDHTPSEIPPIVDSVLTSPGRALDTETRTFFEPRFARDLSSVRIHDDTRAAESATEVGARAWTIGSHIAFGRGAFTRELLAHELAHTIQQSTGAVAGEGITSPDDSSERAADTAAAHVLGSAGILPAGPPASSRPTARLARQAAAPPLLDPARPLPQYGPNPGDCLDPLCDRIDAAPADPGLVKVAAQWRDDSIACIQSGAAASGATHAKEIADDETGDYPLEIDDLNRSISPTRLGSARIARSYRDDLARACRRKALETRTEFRYNVILARSGLRKWQLDDIDRMHEALWRMPQNMVWGNPAVLRFTRDHCAMEAGKCVSSVGGQTGYARDGKQADITMFEAGMRPEPMDRFRSLGLPSFEHSIRHEVGHVVRQQVTEDALDELYSTIMDYRGIDWSLIAPGSATATSSRASLRPLISTDDTEIDTFLNGLAPNVPQTKSGYAFAKVGISTPVLAIARAAQMPRSVPAFTYALTDRSEYFAELFALANSRPEFLMDQISPEQTMWLKRKVFFTPVSADEWAGRAFPGSTPDVQQRLARTYTWPQAEAIIAAARTQAQAAPPPGGGTTP